MRYLAGFALALLAVAAYAPPAHSYGNQPPPGYTGGVIKPKPLPEALQERKAAQEKLVSVHKPIARPARTGSAGVVYFTLRGGAADDTLLAVSTPWAEKAEVHDSIVTADGVVKMLPMTSLKVPAEQTISFEPRGLHIMLMGLKRDLRNQQTFPLVLTFEKAGDVRVMVTVARPAKTPVNPETATTAPVVPPPAAGPSASPTPPVADEHAHHH